jgi:flavin reductase (DIM6/NTAB) family NADH-FMN oxidoreductase RutF
VSVSIDRFKQAASKFASGVTVVTAREGRYVYGITVSAFASLSLDPLSVLVSIRQESRLHEMIRASGAFAVSILREGQRPIAEYFARPRRPLAKDTFPGIECLTDTTGAPIICGSLAHFDCELITGHPAGDHTIFLGGVVGADARRGEPLLYFSGAYHGIRAWNDG